MPAASEWGTPDFSLSRGGRVGHWFRDLDGSGPLRARPAPQPPCPEPWPLLLVLQTSEPGQDAESVLLE